MQLSNAKLLLYSAPVGRFPFSPTPKRQTAVRRLQNFYYRVYRVL